MSKQTMTWIEHAPLSGLARQRPQRFALQFSIDVYGLDRWGRFFTERSETCNVSDAGCRFYLRTEVEREAVVAVRVINRNGHLGNASSPMLFQIAHIERDATGWTLGALKLRAEDAWPAQPVASCGSSPSSD